MWVSGICFQFYNPSKKENFLQGGGGCEIMFFTQNKIQYIYQKSGILNFKDATFQLSNYVRSEIQH